MLRIVEAIAHRRSIDVNDDRLSDLGQLLYLRLLLGCLRDSLLGCSLQGLLSRTCGLDCAYGLSPAAPALEVSQQAPDSFRMGNDSVLQVSRAAGSLNGAPFRRARDHLIRQLVEVDVLRGPLFDPVLILHTYSIVSPVRNG